MRAQQMYIEPVIKRRAEQFEAVDLKFDWRVEKIQQRDNRVYVSAIEATSGITAEFDGDYAVGCDGPRSIVRQTLGISYEGKGAEDRQFMGGRMLATYLDAPALYEIGPNRPSWQYWMLNPERFGVVIAVDGRERFVFHSQLPRDVKGTLEYAEESLRLVVGRDFPHRIIDIAEWTAGFTLVAEHYGSDRIFLAGDAAHLFTPTAGFGYNTAVDDVVNLGWKLAAVCNGWGGSGLLQSYETERKPIGHRNTSFARSIANFFRDLKLPDALEEDSAIGDAQRAEFGKILEDFSRREFNAPGISLGAYYGGSPVVAIEPGEPPKDDPNIYFPTAQPGARAPHLWLSEDRALFDCFGCDFTLLKLNPAKNTVDIENAASARGMPLLVVPLSNTRAQQLYEADLILIRPDQHIAWRGNHPPADPKSLINRVLGFE